MISHDWPHLRLEEVAEVAAGNPAPQDATDFCEGGEPFVRMQDVGREHRTSCLTVAVDKVSTEAIARHRLRLFPTGSVLVPKSGASVNLNHRAMLGRDAYVVSHLAVLVPNLDRVIPEYLYAWSQSYDPRHQAQTTSLPSLPLSLIKAAEIPIPPIPEQRRIVDILSRAEGVVRLRREAEKKANELIPALFLDMFGDPATNPKRWGRLRLEDVCEISYGIADKLDTSINSEQGVRILTISNVLLEGIIDPTVERYCIATDDKIRKCSVQRGDLLFNWRNGSESHIGKTAIWESEERVLHVSFLLRLRPNAEKLNSHFLWSMINLMRAMGFFIGASRQQINRKFNASELSALELPIPPKELQDQFTHKIEQIRSIQSQQSAATAMAQATFDALLAQAFAN